ncbi:MAG TPA: D-glycero-beta-D-manno-heptose 1-phosphate adenylyltransferase [Fimbriimonadaceae bacterium]|nr:D-glycero-beta-D-manno-heptose 1-phosphate adenylyltransferase [Fimbriimonadaceae bacterium]
MSLITLEEALSLRQGRKLVFTNGVFDILHAGHVEYLQAARKLGDFLIVGLNSDASVRALGKGAGRPINPLEDRALVVGALRCVDGVIGFEQTTPNALIEALRPEVHVKGGDYDPESMPETPLVRSYGGEVVILPLRPGRSTTGILRKLADS